MFVAATGLAAHLPNAGGNAAEQGEAAPGRKASC